MHLLHSIVDSLDFLRLSNVSLAPVLCSMVTLCFAFPVASRTTIAVISTNLKKVGNHSSACEVTCRGSSSALAAVAALMVIRRKQSDKHFYMRETLS